VKYGIVGLPNAGKSTLFNALTSAGAQVANYPFTTIDRNVGVLPVMDERLDFVAKVSHSAKVAPTFVEVVDIAGLVVGASRGEGLGNRFLAHIREVDAILHVVRCFVAESVPHVTGAIDARGDVETVETELLLADLETVLRRIERAARMGKGGDRQQLEDKAFLERLATHLRQGLPARSMDLPPGPEDDIRRELFLLTTKPVLFVANLSESDVANPPANPHHAELVATARARGARVIPICARVEAELAEFTGEDRRAMAAALGAPEGGLEVLVRACYELLSLVTFYTANETEARAWTVTAGTTAARAAGKVHSDMEAGFIRAEVISHADLVRAGALAVAKQKGLMRTEGRDYVVTDGDLLLVRFSPPGR
jgi:GTP-binding protein YchF